MAVGTILALAVAKEITGNNRDGLAKVGKLSLWIVKLGERVSKRPVEVLIETHRQIRNALPRNIRL